ncbi:FIVAR domain-containing protein [Mycoplasmoides gallisepticum]|uniref:FIVAR domain-containing protein n=1 Tax=Mycoplasmoides gallisepticum TaxID=2096 RepID=UPI001AD86AFC|nr:FIVAR domain-containing protein [Mycoplasmoides gallisepticum]
MKRKNILKFVSLLGIGSFVMLAAASCTSATTPTPNPEPNPNPNPNPNPKPDPMPNPPSGGMNGVDTNRGNGGGMDNAAQQLAAAKTALTSLLASKNANVEMYSDYAKIKNDLTAAYTTAETASQNQAATLEQVKNATSTLQAAIDKAASDKKTFDDANAELVTAYNNLKTTLDAQTKTLEGLSGEQFSSINSHLTALYKAGQDLATKTLTPADGGTIDLEAVKNADKNIKTNISTESLTKWKDNANTFFNGFEKNVLSKAKLTLASNQSNNNDQPVNYSFVGYSSNVPFTGEKNRPIWYFSQRKVWDYTSNNNGTIVQNASENSIDSLTDVSWIYSLTGEGTKYQLTFNYYGPTTAYLYFPYKLVKSGDSSSVALQYKLNNGDNQQVEFKAATTPDSATVTKSTTAPNSGSASSGGSQGASSSARLVAAEDMQANEMNSKPTVSDINVAKVTLSNLVFGQNTIEFSVPDSKVTPMIGNMYLTSSNSENNKNKIYDDIFGNSYVTKENNSSAITVNLLKGYSLAADSSTYVRQFTNLTNSTQPEENNTSTYLVGFIGGRGPRKVNDADKITTPWAIKDNRTLTIYVNAPTQGEYYISGSYLTEKDRELKLSTDSDSNNSVTITTKGKNNLTTLGTFDTATATEGDNGTPVGTTRTLRLKAGLNKIVIAGGGKENVDKGFAPYIGNLTFTLKRAKTETDTNSSKAA